MKYLYTILALALITSCDAPMQDNGEPEGPHTSMGALCAPTPVFEN